MRVNLAERCAKSATTEGRKSPIFYDDEVISVVKDYGTTGELILGRF